MHLDSIAGNDRARTHLRRALRDGRVAHAYLFTGPAGVGKTATAMAFAADLLEAEGGPPPNAAHPDLWVEDSGTEGISIDLIRMDGRIARPEAAEAEEEAKASKRKPVPMPQGIDLGFRPPPAQTLQGFLSLKGMHSDRRVAVIARAERLRETAASPLLKTIEEPPPGAVLVLCAEAADLLPATVRSRCQEVEFQPLSEPELTRFLAAIGLPLEPRVARLARGCPGRALRLVADPDEVERRLAWAEMLERVRGASWLELVAMGATFGGADSRRNRTLAREAVEVWEAWLRDLAVASVGASEEVGATAAAAGAPPVVAAAWRDLSVPDLLSLWESARETADRILNNVNPRLAVEVFLADAASGRGSTPFAAGIDPFAPPSWRHVALP
ncbi:MAG: DNA polymerase III subunit [Candidatus Dormibacteria bacterium]